MAWTRPAISADMLVAGPELTALRDLGVLGGETDHPPGYEPKLPITAYAQPMLIAARHLAGNLDEGIVRVGRRATRPGGRSAGGSVHSRAQLVNGLVQGGLAAWPEYIPAMKPNSAIGHFSIGEGPTA